MRNVQNAIYCKVTVWVIFPCAQYVTITCCGIHMYHTKAPLAITMCCATGVRLPIWMPQQGREWDVCVDTGHTQLYYGEHLDGDCKLAKGFLQREGAATFSVQSTFIQPAVYTKEALFRFLRFWEEHSS